MVTMHHFVFIVFLCLSIKHIHSQVAFQSLCTTEVQASGLPSIDGNDEFEIELYQGKFLPDEAVLCKKKEEEILLNLFENLFYFLVAIKQKRKNYGISEFVLSAFDGDNIVGRFDDQQTANLALKHHICPNGASVCI
jgi:hypothetical protein